MNSRAKFVIWTWNHVCLLHCDLFQSNQVENSVLRLKFQICLISTKRPRELTCTSFPWAISCSIQVPSKSKCWFSHYHVAQQPCTYGIRPEIGLSQIFDFFARLKFTFLRGHHTFPLNRDNLKLFTLDIWLRKNIDTPGKDGAMFVSWDIDAQSHHILA